MATNTTFCNCCVWVNHGELRQNLLDLAFFFSSSFREGKFEKIPIKAIRSRFFFHYQFWVLYCCVLCLTYPKKGLMKSPKMGKKSFFSSLIVTIDLITFQEDFSQDIFCNILLIRIFSSISFFIKKGQFFIPVSCLQRKLK